MESCWICVDATANSREHKAKASDLRSIFGKKSEKPIFLYQRDAFRDGYIKKIKIQSFNDSNLKWGKSICRRCNDTLTQPYDRSWENFLLDIKKESIKNCDDMSSVISAIFREKMSRGWVDLHLYFAKAFGCVVFEANALGAQLPHLKMFADAIRARRPVPDFYLAFKHADQVDANAIQALDFVVSGQQLSWAYRAGDLAVLMAYLPDGFEVAKSLELWHPSYTDDGTTLPHSI